MLESNPSADPGRRMPRGFTLGFFSFFGLNALNSCLLPFAFLPFSPRHAEHGLLLCRLGAFAVLVPIPPGFGGIGGRLSFCFGFCLFCLLLYSYIFTSNNINTL